MDAALAEKLKDIPKAEIDRVIQTAGYSRWTYFTDAEAGEAGVICANDDSLSLYFPSLNATLQPGPMGVLTLHDIQYVPSSSELYIHCAGKYLTLQVFSDP